MFLDLWVFVSRLYSSPLSLKSVLITYMQRLLQHLDVSKASGLDGIEARFLKLGAVAIAPSLAQLFNASLSSGVFPDDWKCAVVSPVYKKGDKSDPLNYRPISLLSCVSKVLEGIVFDQLYHHLESRSYLPDCQYGFRKGRSTQDAVGILTDDLLEAKDSRLCSGAVFLDLYKAFDTVDHGRLLAKLLEGGVADHSLRWFRSYLESRTQIVRKGSEMSTPTKCLRGVPQGSKLGPLLFILYTSDLPKAVSSSSLILYADDTCIYSSGPTYSAVVQSLQRDLDSLSNWFDNNLLYIRWIQVRVCTIWGVQRKKDAVRSPLHCGWW